MDAKSKEGLPFVTIQYNGDRGVITNMDGYFSISERELGAEKTLIVSAMGYLSKKADVSKLRGNNWNIELSEAVNQLSNVFLTNKRPNIDSIMARVNRNVPKNYDNRVAKYNLFSRQSTYFDPTDVTIEIDKSSGFSKKQLEESNAQLQALSKVVVNRPPSRQYIDILLDMYFKEHAESKIEVAKAMKLLDINNKASFENIQDKATAIIMKHLDATKTYTLKSGLFTLDDSLTVDFKKDLEAESKKDERKINRDNLNNTLQDLFGDAMFGKVTGMDFVTDLSAYDYTLEDVNTYNDELIYVVNFTPKRHRAKFKGTLYIAENDYAILKINYAYSEGKKGESLNLRLLLGLKYSENIRKGTIIYSKEDEGSSYYPHYINQQMGQYIYVHRPLKFIENGDETNNKAAFDFIIEGTIMETQELLSLSNAPLTLDSYNAFNPSEYAEYEILDHYDPNVWQSLNSIEPLEEMKKFRAEGK